MKGIPPTGLLSQNTPSGMNPSHEGGGAHREVLEQVGVLLVLPLFLVCAASNVPSVGGRWVRKETGTRAAD